MREADYDYEPDPYERDEDVGLDYPDRDDIPQSAYEAYIEEKQDC